MDSNEIINKVNEIFRQPNLQKIKDYVSSHIVQNDDEICKRKIGKVEDINIFFVNASEVGVKCWMDFVDGGNDMAYGVNSANAIEKFIPDFEVWIDSHIDLCELRFILIHELYEREQMKYKDLKYEEAHELANKLEKKLKKQFLDNFTK